MLLAIDTSAGTSVAVVDAGRVLAEADEAGTRSHAEAIGTLIAEALERAGIAAAEVTAVVSGMGPGPFTGLRVGIAAARAFAAGRGIPVHPVPSHDAVAHGRDAATLVVTDARRREVAWTAYRDGVPDGPHLAHPDELPALVEDYAALERVDAARIPAASLALVAERRLADGLPTGPEQPLYLRAPDVTLPHAPKRVTG